MRVTLNFFASTKLRSRLVAGRKSPMMSRSRALDSAVIRAWNAGTAPDFSGRFRRGDLAPFGGAADQRSGRLHFTGDALAAIQHSAPCPRDRPPHGKPTGIDEREAARQMGGRVRSGRPTRFSGTGTRAPLFV